MNSNANGYNSNNKKSLIDKIKVFFMNKNNIIITLGVIILLIALIISIVTLLNKDKYDENGKLIDSEVSDSCNKFVNSITDMHLIKECDKSSKTLKNYVLNGKKIDLKIVYTKDDGDEYYFELFLDNKKLNVKLWDMNYKEDEGKNYIFNYLTITELMDNNKVTSLILSNHLMGQCAYTNNYAIINNNGEVKLSGNYAKLELGNTNENIFKVEIMSKYFIDKNAYCIENDNYNNTYGKDNPVYKTIKSYSYKDDKVVINKTEDIKYNTIFKK